MVVRNCANVVLLHGNGEIGGSADEVDLSAAGVSIYDTQPLPWVKYRVVTDARIFGTTRHLSLDHLGGNILLPSAVPLGRHVCR